MLTKIEVAQHIANMAVASAATKVISHVLETNTEIDTDKKSVDFAVGVAGFVVADRLRPQTNAAVATVAAKFSEIRMTRKNRKNEK